MARGQGDYFQATRGGGHGDYRHDRARADRRARGGRADAARVPPRRPLAQPGADLRRLPARPHRPRRSTSQRSTSARCPRRTGPSTASLGGTRPLAQREPARHAQGREGHRPRERSGSALADKHERDRGARSSASRPSRLRRRRAASSSRSARSRASRATPCASCAPRARASGFFRPITLWPFPAEALARAAAGARRVAVLEQNAGQMIDDVRLARARRACRSSAIGGISSDESGFGIGDIYSTRRRARAASRG